MSGLCLWVRNPTVDIPLIDGDNVFNAAFSEKILEIGDLCFSANDSVGLEIWSITHFSATDETDYPYVIRGSWVSSQSAYAIWRNTIFSYTTTPVRFVFSAEIEQGYSTNVFSHFTETIRILKSKPWLYNGMSITISSNYPPSENIYLNTSTEAYWLEEVAAPSEWQIDRLTFSSSLTGGGGSFTTYTYTGIFQGPNTVFTNCVGYVRSDIEAWVNITLDIVGAGGTIYDVDIMGRNAGGTASEIKSTAHNDATREGDVAQGMPRVAVGGLNREYVVMSLGLWTGSKPEQGYLEVFEVDASLNITKIQILDDPAPARYGRMGYSFVDMVIKGTDVYIVAGKVEALVFFKKTGTGANTFTFYQQISFARNDLIQKCAVCNEYGRLAIYAWIDANNQYRIINFWWNSTDLWRSGNYIATVPFSMCFVGKMLHFDYSGGVASYESTDGNWISHSIPVLTGKRIPGYTDVYPVGSLIVYDVTTYDLHLYDVDDVAWTVTENHSFSEPVTGAVTYCVYYDPVADELGALNYYSTGHGYSFYEASAGVAFDDGHFYVSSNAAGARVTIPDDATGFANASIDCIVPANAEIRFAYSLDGGSTWLTWNGSTNVQLTNLADIKVNGSDYTNFNVSMQAVDMTTIKTIGFAFAMNRPVTVDPAESPYITGITYVTNDSVDTWTYNAGTGNNLLTNFGADPDAITMDSMKFLFFDELKL